MLHYPSVQLCSTSPSGFSSHLVHDIMITVGSWLLVIKPYHLASITSGPFIPTGVNEFSGVNASPTSHVWHNKKSPPELLSDINTPLITTTFVMALVTGIAYGCFHGTYPGGFSVPTYYLWLNRIRKLCHLLPSNFDSFSYAQKLRHYSFIERCPLFLPDSKRHPEVNLTHSLGPLLEC